MSRKPIYIPTQELVEDLATKTSEEVCKKWNLKPSTVRYLRSRWGIKVTVPRDSMITEEMISEATRRPVGDVAKEYGVPYPYLYYAVCRRGLKPKPRNPHRRRARIPSKAEIQDKTVSQVCKEFGAAPQTVRGWFRKYGIAPKEDREVRRAVNAGLKKIQTELKEMKIVMVLPWLSNAEIARALNVSREYVRQIREKYGVKKIELEQEFNRMRKEVREIRGMARENYS